MDNFLIFNDCLTIKCCSNFHKIWRYNSIQFFNGTIKLTHFKLLKSAVIHIKFDRNSFHENLHNYGVILFTNVFVQKCLYSGKLLLSKIICSSSYFKGFFFRKGNTAMETLAYQDLIYNLQYCGGICGFNNELPSTQK